MRSPYRTATFREQRFEGSSVLKNSWRAAYLVSVAGLYFFKFSSFSKK